MIFPLRVAVLTLACTLALPANAEGTAPPTPEQLAAQERVRPLVTAIWDDLRGPTGSDEQRPRLFWDITDRLIALGPDVVPFLENEIDLAEPQTFNIAAYALGRIGGAPAEAALRKAVRAADARGGRFGIACKQYAIFALGLIGRPDVFELAQSGAVSLHGTGLVPDLPLQAHVALLVGRDAGPILSRQLDTYSADPKAVDPLEDTLFAVGRAGDTSLLSKLPPLVAHPATNIRVDAAEAISRLGGDPAMCESLIPLLSSKNMQERIIVSAALERWKPQPCYKSIVGRLEVETDVPVRANLYAAVAAMGGEAALPVMRAFLGSSNQFDQAVVIDCIGRIGSKKGLELLRSIVQNGNPNSVAHALEAIAKIGGEGAIDTLLATASDRRPFVSNSAKEILTRMGDKRIAPRRAEELLVMVREPVGNISLRYRVVELTEALVTLEYAEPLPDLKAALAVQTDLEIIDTLTSGVRRLECVAKDKDDAAAWAGELGSTFKDVRQLADRRLAEIGSAPAVKALTTRLARTDLPPDERAGILSAIGSAKTPGCVDLIERHLADPAFDAWPMRDARAAAAYAARRLGGERMARALRSSAIRRDGQDWATLIYLTVLDPKAASETLLAVRTKRVRYPEAHIGHEDNLIEEILKDLQAGRSVARFDVPPQNVGEL